MEYSFYYYKDKNEMYHLFLWKGEETDYQNTILWSMCGKLDILCEYALGAAKSYNPKLKF